jgi:ankyrin repeat protein
MFNRIFGNRNIPQPSSLPTALPTATPQPSLASAIASKNLAEVERQLRDPGLPAETLHTALDQACSDKSCPNVIKLALLQHPACDAKGALGLAIRHDDLYLAGEALKLGGIPERDQVSSSSERMRGLFTTFRRRTTLYPPGSARNNPTRLDRKLRDGDDAAAELLLRKAPGLTSRDTWSKSVQQDRPDRQRAFLLLAKADKDRRFRLGEVSGATVKDPAVRQIMKEIPQYSPKRGYPQDFNMEVEGVVCRTFVEDLQTRRAGDPALKSDYDDYKDLETIAARIKAPPGKLDRLEERVRQVLAHAPETHLIDNRKLSSFIAAQLETMDKNGEPARQIVWNSTNHAMDLALRIKSKNGEKRYVIKHYDPNFTTSHVRIALSSLEAVEALTLKQILSKDNLIKHYWPEGKGLSTMTVRPPEEEIFAYAQRPAGAVAGRKLISTLPPGDIDATAIWHMLTFGFSGDLRSLKSEIAGRPVSKLRALLGTPAGIEKGAPGLYMALQNGHADAVRAFGEIVAMLPKELRGDLLACKRANGTSGLFMALQNGHAETVRAFGEIVAMLPEELRGDLLACKDADRTPGLYMALQKGHAEAVRAFGESVAMLPEKLQGNLLTCKRADRTPGLSLALQKGHADAVRAFGEIIATLPDELQGDLLACKDADRTPGLYMALQEGHAEAVRAFGEIVAKLHEELRGDLLACKDDDETPGLYMALQNGHADAVKAFGESLSLLPEIPENLRKDIVACKDKTDLPALSHVLGQGNREAILAYGALLKTVPPPQRASLLAAKDANGNGGLAWAIRERHKDAVLAYGELLLDCIPPAQFAEVLLAARDEGYFATDWAIQNRDAEAFFAFRDILSGAFSKAVQEGDTTAVLALENVLKELPLQTQAEIISATDGLAAMLHQAPA